MTGFPSPRASGRGLGKMSSRAVRQGKKKEAGALWSERAKAEGPGKRGFGGVPKAGRRALFRQEREKISRIG